MPWKLRFEVQKYIVKQDEFTSDLYFQLVISAVYKNIFGVLLK